jgi:hypothetical protein
MKRSKKKYCVICGQVTSWTKGYCPFCAERVIVHGGALVSSRSSKFLQDVSIESGINSKDFRWNGKTFERVYVALIDESVVSPFSPSLPPEEAEYAGALSTRSPKSRLMAYHKFLSDVYRKPMRFSDLLEANSVLEAQISRWRRNFEWVHHFLTVFQVLLEARLNLILEDSHPIILRWIYGLDGEAELEISIISDRLSISERDVAYCSKRLIQFLCSREGHELIEETITHVNNALGSA